MKPRKVISYLLAAFFISSFSSITYADVLELKNGQMLEAVIQSEDDVSYSALLDVGLITISKESVLSIKEYDQTANQELLNSWKKPSAKAKAILEDIEEALPKKTDKEVRYIRYDDTWITEKEYEEIQKTRKLSWQERVEEEKERIERLKEEALAKKLETQTEEMIIQGADRRSEEANRALTKGDWRHRRSDHFLIFYQGGDTGRELEEKAEFFLNRIAIDLGIPDQTEALLKDKIEIIAIEDPETWEEMLQGKQLPDSPNGFSKIFKKELFLFIESEYDIQFVLPHEITHILFQIYLANRFNEQAECPLWLGEGFANFQGDIINMSAAEDLLKSSVRLNKHIPLAELVTLPEYPAHPDRKILFYAESTYLIHFIFVNYGREAFLEFLDLFLTEYNRQLLQKKTLKKKDGKEIFERALDGSSLSKEFVSTSSFEEQWMKSLNH